MKLYNLPADQVYAIKEATDSLINRLGVLDLDKVKNFYLCIRFAEYTEFDYVPASAKCTFKLSPTTYNKIVEDIEKTMLTKYGTKVSFNLAAKYVYCAKHRVPRYKLPGYNTEVQEYARDLRYNYLWKLNTQVTRLINKRIKEGK